MSDKLLKEINQFLCPISQEIMKDPVVAEDGFSYERENLVQWLENHDTSPMTRGKISRNVRPNNALRQMIRENTAAIERVSNPPNLVISPENTTIAKLGECFKVMDKLRPIFDESTLSWSPPSVVVFGDENVGKSTLVNRIIGRNIVPMGNGVCTRVAIEVRLRRDNTESAYIWHSKNAQINQARPSSGVLGMISSFFGSNQSIPLDCTKDIEYEVRRAMNEILKKQESITTVSTQDFILLELNGPNYPNLDLIDLPGMTREGERNEPSQHLTKLFLEQRKNRSVLLGVMKASSKPNQTTAMEIVGTQNLHSKAIGVLTKCDEIKDELLEEFVSDVINFATDTATNLGLGYFATMLNLSNGDEERWFCSKKGLSNVVIKQRTGVNDLIKQMNQEFLKHIAIDWIPSTLQLLIVELDALVVKEKNLGVPKEPSYDEVASEILSCVRNAISASKRYFTKFQNDLADAWSKCSGNRNEITCRLPTFSFEDLRNFSHNQVATNEGLLPPWSIVLEDVNKLIVELQCGIANCIEQEMMKTSPIQLTRFPIVIEETKLLFLKQLTQTFSSRFIPWLLKILQQLQSMIFFQPIYPESQLNELHREVLVCIGIALDVDIQNELPKILIRKKRKRGEQSMSSKFPLEESCKEERDSLEQSINNVQIAISELKKLKSQV